MKARRWLACILLASATLILTGCISYTERRGAVPGRVVRGEIESEVRASLSSLTDNNVPGITAIVMRKGTTLLRVDVGSIRPRTMLPIASSSKWLAAATLMTLVDDGLLSLDEPISTYLADFRGECGRVTLRQLLSQTSGQGDLRSLVDVLQNPCITLAESAARVARRPLKDPPGTIFSYGGPGFQVAGAAAEAVTGTPWAELFQRRVAGPLGMNDTFWIHLPAWGVGPERTCNPLLQGGAVTTAEDYMRFLTMLSMNGSYAGKRILSEAAVESMETVQTFGVRRGYIPRWAKESAEYGLGNWCETWEPSGRGLIVSCPGLFGSYPWLDRSSGLYGIFFLKGPALLSKSPFFRIRAKIIRAFAAKTS